jgi:hypothetical protein
VARLELPCAYGLRSVWPTTTGAWEHVLAGRRHTEGTAHTLHSQLSFLLLFRVHWLEVGPSGPITIKIMITILLGASAVYSESPAHRTSGRPSLNGRWPNFTDGRQDFQNTSRESDDRLR